MLAFLSIASVASAQNYALKFDGIDDKIIVPDDVELNPATALTIEVWINAEAWAVNTWDGCLVCKQATNPDKGYSLSVGDNGRVDFCHSIDEGWKSVQTAQILEFNSWYHLAGVYNGSTLKVYVNGVLQGSVDVQGTPTLGTGVDINFAENPTWSGRYFTGTMDEIRIWNVARTQEEIQANMAEELSGPEEGLVGYWNMNVGSGSVSYDISGNYNDGALMNMDETAWVDGFSSESPDVGVLGIASPTIIGTGFSNQEEIKIEVKNFSAVPISNFTVSYKINDGDVVTKVITEPLDVFTSQIYSFIEPVDLEGYNEVVITGMAYLEDDFNPTNNELSQTITKSNDFTLFNLEQHNSGTAGKSHLKTLYLPDDFAGYEYILLHVDLECPEGGCDAYAQPGVLNIVQDGAKYEIARYMTPFGIACGGWTFDITDFKSFMKGKTVFESFIEVWGASGWLVNMQLEFIPGTPEYPYVKIQPLWNETNWVYGDIDISYDLPEKIVPIASTTERVKLRMTVTGHGIGNTLNAAEYAEFTHHIWVNSTSVLDMHLWKDDCDENSCVQSGGYDLARAGWCPGQDIQPWEYNLEGMFEQGSDMNIDFVLASYRNYLNSGYNGSTHTQPYFRIQSYLVQYSAEGFVGVEDNKVIDEDAKVEVYPNPSSGIFNILSINAEIESISVFKIDGRIVNSYKTLGVSTYNLNLSDQTAGIYFLQIVTNRGASVVKVAKRN